MNENLKDYFHFSKSEKHGALFLLIIILILIIFPYFYDFYSNDKIAENQDFEKEIQLFAQSIQVTEKPEFKNRLDQYIIERYDSINLFFFDPNNTSAESFKKLGFTEKQIKTIKNYVQKGGKFFIKDDFRKIYGIRHQQYQIVKPYILLPDESKNESSFDGKTESKTESDQLNSVFVFDPNTATDDDFKKLGLSVANISTIRNYQKKIGKFKSKEDFKKIYGIAPDKLNQLEPYIFITQSDEAIKEIKKVDINSATAGELEDIKGIGKYSADAILRYRDKLGGYIRIEQLMEIKNISSEMFDSFKSNLFIGKSKVREIRLNFAEVNEFAAHPYLNFQQAKEIVKYRSVNGPFQNKNQLLQNKILLEQTFNKIEPYLTVN